MAETPTKKLARPSPAKAPSAAKAAVATKQATAPDSAGVTNADQKSVKPLNLEDIRRDIEREDRNVQYHLAATLPVQGFMIAALTVLLMGTKDPVPLDLEVIRTLAPFGISLIGLVTSLASLVGVIVARVALCKSIKAWEKVKLEDKEGRTNPYGGRCLHTLGGLSAGAVSASMPLFWAAVVYHLFEF